MMQTMTSKRYLQREAFTPGDATRAEVAKRMLRDRDYPDDYDQCVEVFEDNVAFTKEEESRDAETTDRDRQRIVEGG